MFHGYDSDLTSILTSVCHGNRFLAFMRRPLEPPRQAIGPVALARGQPSMTTNPPGVTGTMDARLFSCQHRSCDAVYFLF